MGCWFYGSSAVTDGFNLRVSVFLEFIDVGDLHSGEVQAVIKVSDLRGRDVQAVIEVSGSAR